LIVLPGTWTIQVGCDAIELLWEDGSNSRLCLLVVAALDNQVIPEEQQGGGFAIAAGTRGGLKDGWPSRHRPVPEIPSLNPWEVH